MARRKNIFDFASKELSATAFWAWILDSEQSNDSALTKVNAELRLKLGVPTDAVLETVELEKNPDDPGLKLQSPSEHDEHDGRGRIDILATYRLPDGGFLRWVIENKVRRDPNAIQQVTRYRDRLQKRVSGPVHAAVFTFDNALADSRAAVDADVAILALADMVALVEPHATSNAILDAYVNSLKDKVTIANATPVRGSGDDSPENIARWSVVAEQKGIQPLLDHYVSGAEKYGFVVNHSKGRSIFLTIKNRSPVVSVHPSKSSAVSGLWLGISVTNLARAHNQSFSRADMPVDFAWQVERQSGNEWRFGYLAVDGIDATLQLISDRVSA